MLRAFRELAAGLDSAAVQVLCYHGLDRDGFSAHMAVLAERGFSVLSLEQFTAWVMGTTEIPTPAVLLTFDGTDREQIDVAAPVLQARKWSGVFFPISAYLEDESYGSVLSRRDLVALAEAGHAVGSHSHVHPNLTRLSDAAAEADLTTSKRMLEEVLRHPVTAFCYPNGDFDGRVQQLVRRVGFDLAFTVDLGGVNVGDDRYALRRACVLGNPGPRVFGAFLGGAVPIPGSLLLAWKLQIRLSDWYESRRECR